ncbi:hypothetical protein VNO77_27241 [Canavalia gladiata]|uniref:Uncharacterized protein n=1 Tax=Canavalia gladiata TaxID=3824 RepID=A0AAN9Q406_CANGL
MKGPLWTRALWGLRQLSGVIDLGFASALIEENSHGETLTLGCASNQATQMQLALPTTGDSFRAKLGMDHQRLEPQKHKKGTLEKKRHQLVLFFYIPKSVGVDGRVVTTSDHMLKLEFALDRKIMVSEVLKMLIGSATSKRSYATGCSDLQQIHRIHEEDMFILEINQQEFRLKPMIAQSSTVHIATVGSYEFIGNNNDSILTSSASYINKVRQVMLKTHVTKLRHLFATAICRKTMIIDIKFCIRLAMQEAFRTISSIKLITKGNRPKLKAWLGG